MEKDKEQYYIDSLRKELRSAQNKVLSLSRRIEDFNSDDRKFPTIIYGSEPEAIFVQRSRNPEDYTHLDKYKLRNITNSVSSKITDARGVEDYIEKETFTFKIISSPYQSRDEIKVKVTKTESSDCNHWHCLCDHYCTVTEEIIPLAEVVGLFT